MEDKTKGVVYKFASGIYRLFEIIGEGTFGRVYKGRNETTGDAVAVKIVKLNYIIGT